jgi:hypothetical protein
MPVTVRSSSDGTERKTELHHLGMRFRIREGRRPRKRKKKSRRAGAGWRPEGLLGVWDQFTLADFRAFPLFLRDLLGHLNLRVRRLEIWIATPDPALKAVPSGWVSAMVHILQEKWLVRIEPSFTEELVQIPFEPERTNGHGGICGEKDPGISARTPQTHDIVERYRWKSD